MTAFPVRKMNDALARAEAHSPYLRMLTGRFPDTVEELGAGKAAHLDPPIDPGLPVAQALRQAKGRQALSLAICDLAGVLTLEEVVGHLSRFADVAMDSAIKAAIEAITPGAEPSGFAAIALGKHGSGELNYSSDIDPILIFDPDTLPRRARDEPVETAVRIGRKLIELMQARDGDGYVFRVDLRLRPTPEVTPIVLPVGAAITYYESQALPWERAAFIRARACAGDVALGQAFLTAIQPFIWRRGLDFGAINEIRGISRRIRDHYAEGQVFRPGYDLKRGRGGIREVEFYAQIHQLIHGGRDASLRAPATLNALDALGNAGWIAEEEVAGLSDAYRLYRTIEHRLQMVDDQQTHSLPRDAAALANVARLHGLESGEALMELLEPHIVRVGTIYDGLDGKQKGQLSEDPNELSTQLKVAGFGDPKVAIKRVAHWRDGRIRSLRTPAAREAFEAVLPTLLEALGKAPDPDKAINRFSNLIEGLPSAINLFRLLEAQPVLLKLLVDIMSHAPTLAEALGRRPELLDRLIDASAFDPIGSVDEIAVDLMVAGDLESKLDHIRRIVGEHRFALGVQVLVGASDPMDVAGGYARLAEAAIQSVVEATKTEFEAAHGRVPGSEFIVLALGRMGGAELTHASDLDLIYLFSGNFAATSDGAKPLGAVHYYNRLAQRVTAGLSVATAAGPLYDVDTRLRPSGADGPLSVSLEAFEKYQKEEAWTWEHMALTRARVVAGPVEAVDRIIAEVLNTSRDPAKTLADAAKMRSDIARHKLPKGALDVKLLPGGLVDLEFVIHVLQLVERKAFHPQLGEAIAALIGQGLVPDKLGDAHRLMTRTLVTLRLLAPDLNEPDPATRAIIARACGMDDWPGLLQALSEARQHISSAWAELISDSREI